MVYCCCCDCQSFVSGDLVQCVIDLKQRMYQRGNYGPFEVGYSPDLDYVMDQPYFIGIGWNVRGRVLRIEGITDVRLDRCIPRRHIELR
jgi:hypothetical protein